MGMKIDIDALLADDELEIVLRGKTYIVKDVPLATFLDAARLEDDKNDPEALHKQLALILGIDKVELDGLGLKAVGMTLMEVRKWVLNSSGMPAVESGGAAGSGNP
jgi:hypothetical protein